MSGPEALGRVKHFGHRPSRNGPPDQLDLEWLQTSIDHSDRHRPITVLAFSDTTITYEHPPTGRVFVAPMHNEPGGVFIGAGVEQ